MSYLRGHRIQALIVLLIAIGALAFYGSGYLAKFQRQPAQADWGSPRLDPKRPVTFFKMYCAECHDNSSGNPPNFLLGESDGEKLAHMRPCWQRLLYRLCMWNQEGPLRKGQVEAMPPSSDIDMIAGYTGHRRQAWITKPRQLMIDFLTNEISKEGLGDNDCSIIEKPFLDFPECPQNE